MDFGNFIWYQSDSQFTQGRRTSLFLQAPENISSVPAGHITVSGGIFPPQKSLAPILFSQHRLSGCNRGKYLQLKEPFLVGVRALL
jgi:hypothetical protein